MIKREELNLKIGEMVRCTGSFSYIVIGIIVSTEDACKIMDLTFAPEETYVYVKIHPSSPNFTNVPILGLDPTMWKLEKMDDVCSHNNRKKIQLFTSIIEVCLECGKDII